MDSLVRELLEVADILCDDVRGSVCGCESCQLFDLEAYQKWEESASEEEEWECPFVKIKKQLTANE